jgi:hypothetical protein
MRDHTLSPAGRRSGRPYETLVFKVTVGRATVPANTESISGCGLARDHTPQSGLSHCFVAAGRPGLKEGELVGRLFLRLPGFTLQGPAQVLRDEEGEGRRLHVKRPAAQGAACRMRKNKP